MIDLEALRRLVLEVANEYSTLDNSPPSSIDGKKELKDAASVPELLDVFFNYAMNYGMNQMREF